MKILIIDDEEDMRFIISVCLTQGGYEVIQAASGKDALQILAMQKPDAIIVDYLMPEMSGLTLMNQLQNEKSLSSIPFIYLTAKSDPTILAKLMKSGANGIIEKPFDPVSFVQLVQKLLNI